MRYRTLQLLSETSLLLTYFYLIDANKKKLNLFGQICHVFKHLKTRDFSKFQLIRPDIGGKAKSENCAMGTKMAATTLTMFYFSQARNKNSCRINIHVK